MNALQLIKQDHDKVKDMLARLDALSEGATKTRMDLFNKLREELRVHEAIEEEILYPTVRERAKAADLVDHSLREHHKVDDLAEEISDMEIEDEEWSEKVAQMRESLLDHIQEEEEELFARARESMDEEELEELGDELEERKAQLINEHVFH